MAIVQPRRAAYSRIARFLHRQRLLVIRRNPGIEARPEHFRRCSCLAKKRYPVSPLENAVFWAFQDVTQPWPESIL
jgi:hypothetical protein